MPVMSARLVMAPFYAVAGRCRLPSGLAHAREPRRPSARPPHRRPAGQARAGPSRSSPTGSAISRVAVSHLEAGMIDPGRAHGRAAGRACSRSSRTSWWPAPTTRRPRPSGCPSVVARHTEVEHQLALLERDAGWVEPHTKASGCSGCGRCSTIRTTRSSGRCSPPRSAACTGRTKSAARCQTPRMDGGSSRRAFLAGASAVVAGRRARVLVVRVRRWARAGRPRPSGRRASVRPPPGTRRSCRATRSPSGSRRAIRSTTRS